MREACMEAIRREKVIAIVRGVAPETCLSVAKALYAGGIRLMEITFAQREPESFGETAQAIHTVAEAMKGKMDVGAGTVLTIDQLHLAYEAGAKFIISPNVNTGIIEKTREVGMVSLPGAFTPSEIMTAYEAGADFVKLFPVAQMGPAYVKAVCAPISHVPMLAVGGINETNIRSFLDAGCVGAGVGGTLVNAKAIAAGQFEKLTEAAKALIFAVNE